MTRWTITLKMKITHDYKIIYYSTLQLSKHTTYLTVSLYRYFNICIIKFQCSYYNILNSRIQIFEKIFLNQLQGSKYYNNNCSQNNIYIDIRHIES